MTSEIMIASFLVVCLGCFFSVNLHNILSVHKKNDEQENYADVESPSGFTAGLAALGTLFYFVEACSYVFVAFSRIVTSSNALLWSFQSPFLVYMQVIGVVMTTVGYSLFIWSVVARGRYATSWGMRASHRLVTWGPYQYVRHPSYLGYFLMFLGLIAIWPNPITLIPLIAIPGYTKVTLQEEKLLEQRFGDEYREYQKKTGRFVPKF